MTYGKARGLPKKVEKDSWPREGRRVGGFSRAFRGGVAWHLSVRRFVLRGISEIAEGNNLCGFKGAVAMHQTEVGMGRFRPLGITVESGLSFLSVE